MRPEVIGTLIPFGAFVMIVFIVWFITRQKQARVQARTELHKHLLDRFGSGTELAQFLETEGGKKMIEDLGKADVSPEGTRPKTRDRWNCSDVPGSGLSGSNLSGAGPCHTGGLLLAIGIGFLIGAFVTLRLSNQEGET